MQILVIIPARGGSKGIPQKNLIDLGGKPLVAHTIISALGIPHVDRVIVSTDEEAIAAVARNYGVDVPFLRPRSFAGDTSLIGDVIRHTLNTLQECEGYTPDAFVVLLPTSPFRRKDRLERLTSLLIEGRQEVRVVKTVADAQTPLFSVAGDGMLLTPVVRCANAGYVCPTFYRAYGYYSGHMIRPARLPGVHVEIIDDPVELVDIDTWPDLRLARLILQRGLQPL